MLDSSTDGSSGGDESDDSTDRSNSAELEYIQVE